MHFPAKLELQFVWDLVVILSEEIVKWRSVTSELRKLKSLDTKKTHCHCKTHTHKTQHR